MAAHPNEAAREPSLLTLIYFPDASNQTQQKGDNVNNMSHEKYCTMVHDYQGPRHEAPPQHEVAGYRPGPRPTPAPWDTPVYEPAGDVSCLQYPVPSSHASPAPARLAADTACADADNNFRCRVHVVTAPTDGGLIFVSAAQIPQRGSCKRKEDLGSDSLPSPKKPRLVFTDLQRRTLQAIFKETKRPSKEMQVTIARQLGLEPTTVGNFFMNARRRSMDKWKDDDAPGAEPEREHEVEHEQLDSDEGRRARGPPLVTPHRRHLRARAHAPARALSAAAARPIGRSDLSTDSCSSDNKCHFILLLDLFQRDIITFTNVCTDFLSTFADFYRYNYLKKILFSLHYQFFRTCPDHESVERCDELNPTSGAT
ncbi:Homeobox protein onecut [Eumeta japonica]|uniref:Homeobox protein onecut n=1 Tax=Eumeta variegata TaxID=151549 RepID=A0A4C1UXN3_EUMVA|nr:Homeobox protein onecut [Eumeta japonica]